MAFEDLLRDTPLTAEDPGARQQKKRIISAVNLLAITTGFIALIFGPLLGSETSHRVITIPSILEGLLFLSVPFLNFHKKHRFALAFLYLLHTLAIGYFCVVLGPETNLTSYVVFLLVAAFMLFSNVYLLPAAVSLNVFMVIAVLIIQDSKIVEPITLTMQNIRTMNILSNLAIIFLTASLLYTYTQERRHNEQLICEAMEEKDSFIKGTTHELRGSIQIMGLVLESANLTPNGSLVLTNKEYEFANHAAISAMQTINEIQDWSLIQAGKGNEITLSVINLHDWLHGTKAFEKLRKGQVTVYPDYSSAPEWIVTDRIKLTTLLQNLIMNGVKFAKETVFIVAELDQEGKLIVRITDDGPGIPEAQATDIFKPFISTPNQAFKSTGLGLAIAMHMKQALRGDMSLESDPGLGGTTFRVSIPIEIASAFEIPNNQEIDLSGSDILLIEDNTMQRMLLTKILRSKGILVRDFASVYEAIRAIRENRPDLIISDIELPKFSGFELLASLRHDQEYREIPFILTSGNKIHPEDLKPYDQHITGFILKPFAGYRQISREIQRLLSPKELHKSVS
ncbi:hybrid sensor histidine kinase/response regulator [Chitinophaga barathri]|uniref:histidine kinase n=1 Tax=Chitinophaga barathri TaxID=1647451 RepID=A0A3N4MBW4_9BACT|nr:response regulator [Chitinophaga barathri]RPD39306.1 response regulator [Chitinophaga barathri]